MIARRPLLGAGACFLLAAPAWAQYSVWSSWLGRYAGALHFYRSLPLEDIYPPPQERHVELDDPAPFGLQFAVRTADEMGEIWLRIDGGPMQTSTRGETLRFGVLVEGAASLASAEARPAPRSATLIVRPDLFTIEALFSHADGSFWRRHFTARRAPAGVDLTVWVFDAAGTRARTWRGAAIRNDD
jgi:hypothetical protein